MDPLVSTSLALIEALHALTERNEATVAAAFAAHRSEYLGWP